MHPMLSTTSLWPRPISFHERNSKDNDTMIYILFRVFFLNEWYCLCGCFITQKLMMLHSINIWFELHQLFSVFLCFYVIILLSHDGSISNRNVLSILPYEWFWFHYMYSFLRGADIQKTQSSRREKKIKKISEKTEEKLVNVDKYAKKSPNKMIPEVCRIV